MRGQELPRRAIRRHVAAGDGRIEARRGVPVPERVVLLAEARVRERLVHDGDAEELRRGVAGDVVLPHLPDDRVVELHRLGVLPLFKRSELSPSISVNFAAAEASNNSATAKWIFTLSSGSSGLSRVAPSSRRPEARRLASRRRDAAEPAGGDAGVTSSGS